MGEKFISSHLRPSPNELEEALRNERRKWRIFRIQQVRAQANEEAQRVRTAVRNEEVRVLQDLREDVRQRWEADRQNRVQELRQEHEDCLQAIGQAHRLAQLEPDAEKVLRERRKQNREAAKRRGCEAGKMAKDAANHLQHERGRAHRWRQEALAKEKIRAAQIARLPTPQAFQPKIPEAEAKVPRVQYHEAGTFTTSTYIPKVVRVEKEIWSTAPDGRAAAEMEMAVQAENEAVRKKAREEEARKREERGQEALTRERVCRLADHLMAGLDNAQHKHILSTFLDPQHISVLEMDERRVREQRRMEQAVEEVLKEPQPSPPHLPLHLTPDTSDGLESIQTSEAEMEGRILSTKYHDMTSFLEQMKRRRDQLLHDIYNPGSAEEEIPVVEGERDTRHLEPEESQDGPGPAEQVDPHLAETVPVDQLPRYEEDGSGVGVGDREGGAPTTADMGTLSSSSLPYVQEGSSSGLGSTEYLSPPLSLPARREFVQDESLSTEGPSDDIHFAETVPVDRLPLPSHRWYTTHHTATTDSETFQESSSDDIHINIELSGGSGSTLKTVTPDEESFPRPTSPVPYSFPGTSSTEYLSPPSVLPADQFSSQELQEKLLKIQEQRRKVQKLIDTMSRTKQQPTSSISSIPSSTYYQRLKGEGSGERPIKRKKKYEIHKRILLKHYLQKLLHMQGEELENISASTVEGSGLSIASLSSVLEYLDLDAGQSSLTPSPPASTTLPPFSTTSPPVSTTSPDSCHTSTYTDIDQVPVRLSSLSTSEEATSTHSDSDNGRDDSMRPYSEYIPSFSRNTKSLSEHLPLHSEEKSELPFSVVSPASSRSIGRRDRNSGMHKSIQDILSALQKVMQEVKDKEGEVLDRSSSLLEPGSFSRESPLLPDSPPTTTTTEVSLTRKMPQSQGGRRLSTIHEVTSDMTESHINVSGSAEYHTPSREYESSLEASSDVSVAPAHIPPPHISSLARLHTDTSSEEEPRISASRKKYIHHHQHLTFDYEYKHKEFIEKEDPKGRKGDERVKTNQRSNNYPVLLPHTAATSFEKVRKGMGFLVPSSVGDSALTKKTSIMSAITGASHSKDNDDIHEKIAESQTWDRTSDRTKDTPRHSVGESTFTSSQDQSQQLHTVYSSSSPPHFSTSPPPDYSHSPLPLPALSHSPLPPSIPPAPRPGIERTAGDRGSSESITSIPDIAEILHRFGLDWAGSMIRKMDRAEQRTSSDTSSGH